MGRERIAQPVPARWAKPCEPAEGGHARCRCAGSSTTWTHSWLAARCTALAGMLTIRALHCRQTLRRHTATIASGSIAVMAVISQTGSTRMNHVAQRQRAWPPSAGSHGFAQLTGVVNEMRICCDEVSHDHVKARNESAVLPRGATRAERSGGDAPSKPRGSCSLVRAIALEVSRGHSAQDQRRSTIASVARDLPLPALALWHAYCPPPSCPHECEKKNARKRMPNLRRP